MQIKLTTESATFIHLDDRINVKDIPALITRLQEIAFDYDVMPHPTQTPAAGYRTPAAFDFAWNELFKKGLTFNDRYDDERDEWVTNGSPDVRGYELFQKLW